MAFVAEHSAALLRTAYMLVGDRGKAEDLLQTALTKTYLHWGRIHDRGAAVAYVRRVLANTATSWWRLRSSSEQPVAVFPDHAAPDPIGARDDQLEMWRHLQSLPRRQRTVLVLRYYEDMTESDIADAMGISPGGVKSLASRALARLRTRFGDASANLVPGEVF